VFGDRDQVVANAAALASILALIVAALAAKFVYTRFSAMTSTSFS
jgi:hypothetical protein